MKVEYIIVKEKSDFCNSESKLKDLLSLHDEIDFKKTKLHVNDEKIDFTLTCEESDSSDDIVFHLIIESESENLKESLRKINLAARAIRKSIGESDYGLLLNTVWDETSQYYSEKCYPLINEIENRMRKLIFLFMFKTLGKEWINFAIPQKVRDSILNNVKRDGESYSNRDILYSANFDHLSDLLFLPYSSVKSVQDVIKMVEKAKEEGDFEELKKLKYQSNWKRYFSEVDNFEELKDKWKTLYKYRNMIAHNRLINEAAYQEANKLVDEINKILDEADNAIQTLNVSEEGKEEVADLTQRVFGEREYTTVKGKARSTGSVAVTAIRKPGMCINCNRFPANIDENGICEQCINLGLVSDEIESVRTCMMCDSDFLIGDDLARLVCKDCEGLANKKLNI